MANRVIKNNKLREVTIKGYKSIAFDNPVTLKLGDVSILLGANGAGKSNIVSFFNMLSYMMSKSFARYWKWLVLPILCFIMVPKRPRSCQEH